MPTVRQMLRPLRPVLAPVRNASLAAQEALYQRRFRTSPIRPVTKKEYERAADEFPYHAFRWRYASIAGRAAGDLILRHRLRSALELGPLHRPVIVGADVMDLQDRPEIDTPRMVVHDATRTPWPVDDASYDLFVALQVFEHLGTSQPEAFDEVRRVARHAVISLPIDWDVEPGNPHYGVSHERALSWFSREPTQVLIGNPSPNKRLIYVFENLA